MPKEAQLNLRQKLFLEHYLATGNATAAASAAGYKKPNKQGPRLLVNDGISARVRERVTASALTAQEVLIQLSCVARLPTDGDSKSVANKLSALRMLGQFHKLFTDDQKQPGEILLRVCYGRNETVNADG